MTSVIGNLAGIDKQKISRLRLATPSRYQAVTGNQITSTLLRVSRLGVDEHFTMQKTAYKWSLRETNQQVGQSAILWHSLQLNIKSQWQSETERWTPGLNIIDQFLNSLLDIIVLNTEHYKLCRIHYKCITWKCGDFIIKSISVSDKFMGVYDKNVLEFIKSENWDALYK